MADPKTSKTKLIQPYVMELKNNIDLLKSKDPLEEDSPYEIEDSPTADLKEAFHVDYLKKQFIKIKDVARPNQFKVSIVPPKHLNTDWAIFQDLDLMVLAKSTKIPAINVKEYVYQRAGQKLYIPTGEVDHGPASITFYNDARFNLRTLFTRWIRLGLHNWEFNIGAIPMVALAGQVIIHHFDYNLNPIYEIKLMNAWPKSISEIELSQETENTAEEFIVEFNYSYQEIYRAKS